MQSNKKNSCGTYMTLFTVRAIGSTNAIPCILQYGSVGFSDQTEQWNKNDSK